MERDFADGAQCKPQTNLTAIGSRMSLNHFPISKALRIFAALVLPVSILGAASVNLDFEAVPVSGPGVYADASGYLASFGITVSNKTPSALLGVTVSDAEVPATKHVLSEYNGTNPETFTLLFSDPVSSLSFVRQQYGSDNSGPAWSAFALDAGGNVIGSVSEGVQFASPSATYSFGIPGISELRFDASNTGQTWSGPPIGSLTFTSAVPEPSTVFLSFAVGVFFLLVRSIRRGCCSMRSFLKHRYSKKAAPFAILTYPF